VGTAKIVLSLFVESRGQVYAFVCVWFTRFPGGKITPSGDLRTASITPHTAVGKRRWFARRYFPPDGLVEKGVDAAELSVVVAVFLAIAVEAVLVSHHLP
jgi:hypothetical protein